MYVDIKKAEDIYIICNKQKINTSYNAERHLLNNLSIHYKTDLIYHSVAIVDTLSDEITEEYYDIFKCKKARLYYTQDDLIDFNPSNWQTDLQYNGLTQAISELSGTKIFDIHTKSSNIMTLYSFKNLEYLKRKPYVFVLLSDSLEYINRNQSKPAILQKDKVKVFNKLYRPSIEEALSNLGLDPKVAYSSDTMALKDEVITLKLRLTQTFRKSVLAKINEYLPSILEEVTNNTFADTLNEINVDTTKFIADIGESLDIGYALSIDVNTKDIL